jgi:hypothetical protein
VHDEPRRRRLKKALCQITASIEKRMKTHTSRMPARRHGSYRGQHVAKESVVPRDDTFGPAIGDFEFTQSVKKSLPASASPYAQRGGSV